MCRDGACPVSAGAISGRGESKTRRSASLPAGRADRDAISGLRLGSGVSRDSAGPVPVYLELPARSAVDRVLSNPASTTTAKQTSVPAMNPLPTALAMAGFPWLLRSTIASLHRLRE